MTRKVRPRPIEKPLTPTELEMMSIVWKQGTCSVHQIVEELPPERQLAYTSVSTVVRILEKKGFLESVTQGRSHLYTAVVDKETYQNRTLDKLVTNLFDGSPALLVQQLIDSKQLSAEDLQELRSSLRARKA
jgi:predicted transcriptional regulator